MPETIFVTEETEQVFALVEASDLVPDVVIVVGEVIRQVETGEGGVGGDHPDSDHATLVVTTDARLSNARTPTAHAASHAAAGTDPVTPASIGASAVGHGHDDLASDAEVDAAVSDLTTLIAAKADPGDIADAVAAHEADSTNVHGIPDTAVLATDSDVASAVADKVINGGGVDTILKITQADYTALGGGVDPDTFYVIVG